MLRIGIGIISLVAVVLWLSAASAWTATFGVVPQQSAQKLARKWGPICAYWSERSGLAITFATAPDIPEFERRLAAGLYDFAYMNPYHYTVFCVRPGYEAFARQKEKRISGIVVVRRDSPYRDLRELAGKTLVFPSPAAFAASILTRAQFRDLGIPIVVKYVKSHDSVYLNVSRGFYEGGGGVVRTLLNTEPSVRDRLRVLWKTESYPPHAIAAHPRVSLEDRRRLLEAMVEMNDDPEAKPLLEAIEFKGFAPAEDREWDEVRALKIDELTQPDKP